jgi:hypothetical protein
VNWLSNVPRGVTSVPACLISAQGRCDAYVLPLLGKDHPQVLVAALNAIDPYAHPVVLDEVDGAWRIVGTLPFPIQRCAALVAQLQAGSYSVQTISAPVLQLGSWQLPYVAAEASIDEHDCPGTLSAPERLPGKDRVKR